MSGWTSLGLFALALLSPTFALAQVHHPEFNGNQAVFSVSAGDPFDVETGIYYRTYLDLSIDDSIPIRFERTQRNQDARSRSFGIGASTSYDMFMIGGYGEVFVGGARSGRWWRDSLRQDFSGNELHRQCI